jgi:SAM-dependent methyltransferase
VNRQVRAERPGGFSAEAVSRLAQREQDNYWFRARNRLIVWSLGRFFPRARTLLEVGCGTGFVLSGIRAAYPAMALTGGELSAAACRAARERLRGVSVLRIDARRIPFAGEFDVVCAFDVIEHVEDDAEVLREMHRALKPAGGLALTVPQHPWLWSAVDEYSGHVRRYTRSELLAKVRAAGFRPVYVTSFVSLLLPALIFSRLRQRGGCDPTAEFDVPRWLNRALERLLSVERGLIRAGLRFPAGGSLLLLATRTETR